MVPSLRQTCVPVACAEHSIYYSAWKLWRRRRGGGRGYAAIHARGIERVLGCSAVVVVAVAVVSYHVYNAAAAKDGSTSFQAAGEAVFTPVLWVRRPRWVVSVAIRIAPGAGRARFQIRSWRVAGIRCSRVVWDTWMLAVALRRVSVSHR